MSTDFESINSRWHLTVVTLVIFAVHAVTLGHDFVDFDDDTIFLNHPSFQLSPLDFIWHVVDMSRPDTWRPVRDLSHYLDLKLHGQSALGAHAHNLVLLLMVAGVCWSVFTRLGASKAVATVATVIAYIHPCQVEVIAWVSGRKDLVASLCLMLVLLLSLRAYPKGWPLKTAALIVVICVAGIASKGHLLVAPLVLILIHVAAVFSGRESTETWPRSLWGTIAVLAAVCISLAPRIMAGGVSLPDSLKTDVSTNITFMDKAQLPLRYLGKLIWPADLNHIYFTPRIDGLYVPMAVASSFLIVLVLALSIRWIRARDTRGPILLLAVSLLLPYMHFKTGVVYMADRYLFLCIPFLSFVLTKSVASSRTWQALKASHRWISTVTLVLLLGIGCLRPQSAFRDSVSLWARMTEVYPESPWGFNRLGRSLYRIGQYREAAGAWLQAAKLGDTPTEYLNNAAVSAMAIGRREVAWVLLQEVLKHDPDHRLATENLRILGTAPSSGPVR